MATKTISRGLLIATGYTEWKPENFQKKLRDKNGIKYFIDVEHAIFDLPNLTSWWTFKVQFITERGSVEIQTVQWFNEDGIYSNNQIKDAEDYLEKMWVAHNKPYYE
jgi:hypothetical protein